MQEPRTPPRTGLDTPGRRSPRKIPFRARLGIQTPTGSPHPRSVHRPLDGILGAGASNVASDDSGHPLPEIAPEISIFPAARRLFNIVKVDFHFVKAASGRLPATGDPGPGHAIAKEAEDAKAPANCRRPLSLVICHYPFSSTFAIFQRREVEKALEN